MKKKLVLLAMLVSFMALSLTFLSCGDDDGSDDGPLKLRGTSWVHRTTKAEVAATSGITEAEVDAYFASSGVTINWPLPMTKIDFPSDNDFTLYSNSGFSNTPAWEEIFTGTYTISDNTVTLNVGGVYDFSLTCTVKGRTLTLTQEDNTLVFTKQ